LHSTKRGGFLSSRRVAGKGKKNAYHKALIKGNLAKKKVRIQKRPAEGKR